MNHRADLEEAASIISQAPALTLLCHRVPDGDAIGSMLALHHLALDHGVDSVASFPEPFEVAPHYRFLPGLNLLRKPGELPAHPEVVVTFDCGSFDRLGELADLARTARHLVVLDHHESNLRFGSVNVVPPDAAATAVVVRKLAALLGWELTREAAICLYTGLITDTGRFQYANTTPEVFALAEELAAFDLPVAEMSRQLFEEHRFPYLQMVGACLARAELDSQLRFVATWVTNFDLDGFGVGVDETEGLIDLVRRTAEADVACVCKETPEGIRVSLRSVNPEINVGVIASRFGGGGHAYASGFTAPYPVTDVVAGIKQALRDLRAQRA